MHERVDLNKVVYTALVNINISISRTRRLRTYNGVPCAIAFPTIYPCKTKTRLRKTFPKVDDVLV